MESANGFSFRLSLFSVIPAQAGTQGRDVPRLIPIFPGFLSFSSFTRLWVPAFRGDGEQKSFSGNTENSFWQMF